MKDNPAFKKLVKKATKMPNAIKQTGCEPPTPKTLDGEILTLEYYWATNLHSAQSLWIFELFNDNMIGMYKQSNWGYEEESKKQELQATTARFIIVKDSKKKHVGYIHYRFVIDNGIPAVYCYELQIAAAYQKRGIGSVLLNILFDLAKKTGMHKVMATVFCFNGHSLAFFHKNGFRLDETSPNDGEHDYVILSRCVLPGKEPIMNNENATIENDIISQLIRSNLGPKEPQQQHPDHVSKSVILKASTEAKKNIKDSAIVEM